MKEITITNLVSLAPSARRKLSTELSNTNISLSRGDIRSCAVPLYGAACA